MLQAYPIWSLALMAAGAGLLYFLARLFQLSNHVLAFSCALIMGGALILIVFPHLSILLSDHTDQLPSAIINPLQFNAGGQLISGLALLLGCLVSIFCGEYLNLDRRFHVFYPLLLIMMTGLTGMVFATDLFSVYLFCELMSINAYALVAFRKDTDTAIEAGYKYLIMGSAATIMMLMGIALVFFDSGSVRIDNLQTTASTWSEIGIICLFIGLGLKSAMVPMHTWLPDAHGRAPSSISAMLSGILVQSVLFTLVKVSLGLGGNPNLLGTIFLIIAGANIIVGNIMALVQQHTKRLLGYSTIAQMGYMMICLGIALRSSSLLAVQGFFFLLMIHAFSKALAFLSKGSLHYLISASRVSDLRGSSHQFPFTAIVFSLGLASLSGLPPLAGFTGKWFLLSSLIDQLDQPHIVAMIIFLAGSVIALGYYLPLMVTMFQDRESGNPPANNPERKKHLSLWMKVPMLLLGLLILLMSFFPQTFMHLSNEAVLSLLDMIGGNP